MIESDSAPRGLNEDIVCLISTEKVPVWRAYSVWATGRIAPTRRAAPATRTGAIRGSPSTTGRRSAGSMRCRAYARPVAQGRGKMQPSPAPGSVLEAGILVLAEGCPEVGLITEKLSYVKG